MELTQKKITITLIVAVILSIVFYSLVLKKSAHATLHHDTVLVRVAPPTQKTIQNITTATGTLVARKSAVITPRAAGYITQINVHEGDTVKAGQLLFTLDNQTEKNALSAAQASYALSQLQFSRDAKLLQRGFITQDMHYGAKVTLKQNQAALATAQTNFDQRAITAPFAGTVGSLPISIGDYVNPGTQLTTLVDNQHLRAEFTLPVHDIDHIQLHQALTITSAAHHHPLNANISYISPDVDQSTQTIAVHAKVNNTAALFKPGEYVTITQNLGSDKNVLLAPEQSVLATINGYSVFIAKNNKAVRVPVTLGSRVKGDVEITAGLKLNDALIVAGQSQLKNNAPIKIDTKN